MPLKVDSIELRTAKGRYAVRKRDHGPDSPLTRAALSEFHSERYLAAVKAAVADAPKLSPMQRDRLRRILAPVVTLTTETVDCLAAGSGQSATGDAAAEAVEAERPVGEQSEGGAA